jgi:hypothetical protein
LDHNHSLVYALVLSCYHNKILKTQWLMNNRNLFIIVLEAGKSPDQCAGKFGVWQGPLSLFMDTFLLCSHMVEGAERGLSGIHEGGTTTSKDTHPPQIP